MKQIRNKKKVITLGLAAILILLVSLGILIWMNNKETKEIPTASVLPSEKTVLSDEMLVSFASPPSLETNVKSCDLMIVGEIVEIKETYVDFETGTAVDDKILEENDGTMPQEPVTFYTIKLDEALIGEVEGKEIVYMEHGHFDQTVTKPTEKGTVVLFLSELEGRSYYTSVQMEHSVFTVDENNSMYSFSNTEELSSYDNVSYKTFAKNSKSLASKMRK